MKVEIATSPFDKLRAPRNGIQGDVVVLHVGAQRAVPRATGRSPLVCLKEGKDFGIMDEDRRAWQIVVAPGQQDRLVARVVAPWSPRSPNS
jgi:hypothetical protein